MMHTFAKYRQQAREDDQLKPEGAAAPPTTHASEIESGDRFGFGANWSRFLSAIDSARIASAEESLQTMLEPIRLEGSSFLDAGSGSGLFSLAAWRLGANVHSFDFDPQSVSCTRFLKESHSQDDRTRRGSWQVEEGSVLDAEYLSKLGTFDVVYSWGVLHHTGDLWKAMDNVTRLVRPHGRLFIAIYNDQGRISRYWTAVKRIYNRNTLLRVPIIAVYTPYFVWLRWLYRRLTGVGKIDRGMSLWYDMIDWLGGYPFQTAKPEAVFEFLHSRGFELRALRTTGGRAGCNEFVFERARP